MVVCLGIRLMIRLYIRVIIHEIFLFTDVGNDVVDMFDKCLI